MALVRFVQVMSEEEPPPPEVSPVCSLCHPPCGCSSSCWAVISEGWRVILELGRWHFVRTQNLSALGLFKREIEWTENPRKVLCRKWNLLFPIVNNQALLTDQRQNIKVLTILASCHSQSIDCVGGRPSAFPHPVYNLPIVSADEKIDSEILSNFPKVTQLVSD